jgi:hypothetical protein
MQLLLCVCIEQLCVCLVAHQLLQHLTDLGLMVVLGDWTEQQ